MVSRSVQEKVCGSTVAPTAVGSIGMIRTYRGADNCRPGSAAEDRSRLHRVVAGIIEGHSGTVRGRERRGWFLPRAATHRSRPGAGLRRPSGCPGLVHREDRRRRVSAADARRPRTGDTHPDRRCAFRLRRRGVQHVGAQPGVRDALYRSAAADLGRRHPAYGGGLPTVAARR